MRQIPVCVVWVRLRRDDAVFAGKCGRPYFFFADFGFGSGFSACGSKPT
jgi:hypothetical protein